MLDFDMPEPEVKEICRLTEMEAIWALKINDGNSIDEVEIVICYNVVDGGGSYFTKAKIDGQEWEIPKDNFLHGNGFSHMKYWVRNKIEKMYPKKHFQFQAKVTQQIMGMVICFMANSQIGH